MNAGVASPNFKANGNITPSTILKIDTTIDEGVIAAGSGDTPIGVAPAGTRNPGGTALDDGFAAIAGENVRVFGIGEVCWLTAGGAVTPGDHIKPNASNQGITASTGNLCVGYALTKTANAGDLMKLMVLPHTM